MKKGIIVYGSTTGVTRQIAGEIDQEMVLAGIHSEVRDVSGVRAQELSGYDLIILGSSTWGDGDLQDDFIEFESSLEGVSLEGKFCAVFGPGEDTYPRFCAAVDILEERLEKCRASLPVRGLKVNVNDGPFEETVRTWARKLVKKLRDKKEKRK